MDLIKSTFFIFNIAISVPSYVPNTLTAHSPHAPRTAPTAPTLHMCVYLNIIKDITNVSIEQNFDIKKLKCMFNEELIGQMEVFEKISDTKSKIADESYVYEGESISDIFTKDF